MRRKIKHIVGLLLVVNSLLVQAQQTELGKTIEAIVESHLENTEDGSNIGMIVEDLEFLAENPININATTAHELSGLYVLNDVQIVKLLKYIEEFGPAYSIYELKTIDGFTPDILKQIQPFIRFGNRAEKSTSFSEELKHAKHQVLIRALGNFQKAKGFLEKEDGSTPFEGNRHRYYTRYRFETSEKISAGITAEKDPGEAFFSGSNKKGFDFYSAHVNLKISSFIENITIGDFVVRAGQGLVLWQGYSNGKSIYTMDISKTNQGLRPYTSVDENFFFRGIGTTLRFGNGKLNVFYSQKNIDANTEQSTGGSYYFTSLQTSGYHRTKNEWMDERSVNDRNIGAIFTWNFNHIKIGATLHSQQFNIPLIRSNQLYNQFRFQGNKNTTGGVDYLYNKGKYQLFGEAALSKSGGKAFVQGIVARLNDQLSFSGLYRHFDKNYHALWANTFAEGNSIGNESGIYLGTKIFPVKFVSLSAYSDYYQSNWINYSTAAPSQGWDILTQADFVFSPGFEFYIRYKREEKDKKFTIDRKYENHSEEIQKIRFHFQLKPTEMITLKTRVETALYKGLGEETGFLIFQDLQFAPSKTPLNLTARLAWFNTQSYNTRIYAYENDLLYTYSIPAYYGKGIRSYLNIKYSISKKIDCWLKLGNTSWKDRETISSGNNEINGRHKTELKFQLRCKI